jgi:hypothetical protein
MQQDEHNYLWHFSAISVIGIIMAIFSIAWTLSQNRHCNRKDDHTITCTGRKMCDLTAFLPFFQVILELTRIPRFAATSAC